MKLSYKHLLVAIVAIAFPGGMASAKTLTQQYVATGAAASKATHSMIVRKGFGRQVRRKFDFDPSGLVSFFDDGTATLTGRLVSRHSPDAYFDVAFDYDSSFLKAPAFKSRNGSVATADTFFRDMEGGTLIGGGILSGLNLSVTRAPATGIYATQFGSGTVTNRGANNRNSNFGMASWFKYSVEQATCEICGNRAITRRAAGGPVRGHVNLDLASAPIPNNRVVAPAPVPLPAGGLLMLSGLAAFAGLRRKRRQTA
ncbi:MAG: VPLPA-CTERM sorting domain-containing protein [Planctomycetes bacterium]|nr:VPLPA-CTERM sorting domain-containing protein [Planctomycetota bacterium]